MYLVMINTKIQGMPRRFYRNVRNPSNTGIIIVPDGIVDENHKNKRIYCS